MDRLLADMFTRLPHAMLFLSTIIGLPKRNDCYYWPDGEINQQALGITFNSMLPAIVKKYQSPPHSRQVYLVDMLNSTQVGVQGKDTCPCHIHPTDHGYDLMAQVFFESMQRKLPALGGGIGV